jgi:hypothetical protein
LPIEDPRAAIAAIWISPMPVKGEAGAVIRATMTSIAGVGRNGTMFPPILTKKTSKSGFPLNNETRESMMGKADSGEPFRTAPVEAILLEKAALEGGTDSPI